VLNRFDCFHFSCSLRCMTFTVIDPAWAFPFVRIALPSSLMLWLEVVPSDGIGILPLICAWPPRGCTGHLVAARFNIVFTYTNKFQFLIHILMEGLCL
jgi:hypothetical protein